jgi:hypothetical protein
MTMHKARTGEAFHEWSIYRAFVEEGRRAQFNRYEWADHEETFRNEALRGEWAIYKLLCEQTRFLRECNRAKKMPSSRC